MHNVRLELIAIEEHQCDSIIQCNPFGSCQTHPKSTGLAISPLYAIFTPFHAIYVSTVIQHVVWENNFNFIMLIYCSGYKSTSLDILVSAHTYLSELIVTKTYARFLPLHSWLSTIFSMCTPHYQCTPKKNYILLNALMTLGLAWCNSI